VLSDWYELCYLLYINLAGGIPFCCLPVARPPTLFFLATPRAQTVGISKAWLPLRLKLLFGSPERIDVGIRANACHPFGDGGDHKAHFTHTTPAPTGQVFPRKIRDTHDVNLMDTWFLYNKLEQIFKKLEQEN
jgi:hypothetical protein